MHPRIPWPLQACIQVLTRILTCGWGLDMHGTQEAHVNMRKLEEESWEDHLHSDRLPRGGMVLVNFIYGEIIIWICSPGALSAWKRKVSGQTCPTVQTITASWQPTGWKAVTPWVVSPKHKTEYITSPRSDDSPPPSMRSEQLIRQVRSSVA